MLILIGLQIYIIAAAYTTNYVQQARTDFQAIWEDRRRSIERISYLEQRVNLQLYFSFFIYFNCSLSSAVRLLWRERAA